MDLLCTLFHKHLPCAFFLFLSFSLYPLTLTPSVDICFGAKSLNNYANACKTMHNTVWKWLREKMDSLRTDGRSAKSHLLWTQEDISDDVRTWETSDMFSTPSTICCAGVVLDYFSVLVITNELLSKQYKAETSLCLKIFALWKCTLSTLAPEIYIYIFVTFFYSVQGMADTFHHRFIHVGISLQALLQHYVCLIKANFMVTI